MTDMEKALAQYNEARPGLKSNLQPLAYEFAVDAFQAGFEAGRASQWVRVEDATGNEFWGYHPEWVDDDFNPQGIRPIAYAGDHFICARWTPIHDEWITDKTCEQPEYVTHAMLPPPPPPMNRREM